MIKTLSVMLLASSVGAIAQSAQQKIVDMSVLVGGFISQGGKMKPVTVSGGVVLDARHVLTASSCCGKTDQGQTKVPVVLQGKEVIVGQPVWSGPGFYVIVETEKPLQSGGPVTFAPEKVMQENQPAYTVDFPKNSDPTIIETKIVGKFTTNDSKIDSYKAQPAPESVYMGGGLFNACGQVMGMNMLVKDGMQFAVVSDHAFPGIEKVGIQANVADSPCGGDQSNSGPPHQGKAKEKEKSGDGDGDEESPGGWRLPKGGEWVGVAIIVGDSGRGAASRDSATSRARVYDSTAAGPLSAAAAAVLRASADAGSDRAPQETRAARHRGEIRRSFGIA